MTVKGGAPMRQKPNGRGQSVSEVFGPYAETSVSGTASTIGPCIP